MDENKINANTQSSKSNAKKITKQLNRLLRLMNKYKALGAALGVVLTCYWNLLCDIFYRGYAARLGVDSLYIHKDSGSLLISVLAFFFGFALIIPFANKLSDQLDKNGRSILATLQCVGISFAISFIAFVVIGVLVARLGQQMAIEIAFIPLLFLTLSFSSGVVFFLQLIVLPVSKFWHFLKEKKNKTNENAPPEDSKINEKQSTNSNDSTEPIQDSEKSTSSGAGDVSKEQDTNPDGDTKSGVKIRYILMALIFVALSMAIFFYAGRYSATEKKEFAFIVNDFKVGITFSNTVQHNLILSETDEYYCLSAYTITNKNKTEKVTVYTGHQTVINKSEIKEEIKIVKKKFDESEIVNDVPATQRGVLFPL